MNQQIKYRNRYNSPKGITIVALVVTIVIMLILVGVTVTIAINGGLIGTAKDSKEETRYTQVLAEKEMWEQEERPTERFGIKSETLEDLITRLENEKLLTKKEAEEVRKDGMTTIAKKWLVFGARKNVADASLWEYKLDKKTNLVTITKYLGVMDDLTELTIPNFLLIDGKEYRVTKIEGHDAWQAIANFNGNVIISKGITEIGKASFNGANKITGVEIPDSVTLISDYAFQYCKSLTKIEIPGTVKKIGNWWGNVNGQIFNGCSNLKEVILEEGIEEISGRAFDSCSKVKEWKLPKSLKRIGPCAFRNISVEEFNIPENVESIAATFISSSNLSRINVDSNNKYFTSVDGILFDKDSTRLIKYPENRDGNSYEVPNTVKTIDANAFISCKNLQTIVIADSVEKIGDSAFDGSKLKTINLGGGITNISNKPFYGAWNLTNINVITENDKYESENGILFNKGKTILIKYPPAIINGEVYEIPNTVVEIGPQSFYRSQIKNVIIPSSVKKIGSESFFACYNLEEVNLPEGLERIEWRALYGCHKIKTIVVPSSVTFIDGGAFNNMGRIN
jgi:hypothetical protein